MTATGKARRHEGAPDLTRGASSHWVGSGGGLPGPHSPLRSDAFLARGICVWRTVRYCLSVLSVEGLPGGGVEGDVGTWCASPSSVKLFLIRLKHGLFSFDPSRSFSRSTLCHILTRRDGPVLDIPLDVPQSLRGVEDLDLRVHKWRRYGTTSSSLVPPVSSSSSSIVPNRSRRCEAASCE